MENIADLTTWIKQLSLEVERQTVAVRELAVSFADGEERQVRHDQAAFLRSLKTRIMWEVENIRRMESAAQSRANNRALFGGGAAFTLGSLFAAGIGRKDAFSDGARMAQSILTRTVPFGTVHIAVGKGGLPEDLKVIPVSRLARESSMSESEVVANFRNNGYLSMTPEAFTKVLNKVERGIFDGSVSLPIGIDEITKQIPEGY